MSSVLPLDPSDRAESGSATAKPSSSASMAPRSSAGPVAVFASERITLWGRSGLELLVSIISLHAFEGVLAVALCVPSVIAIGLVVIATNIALNELNSTEGVTVQTLDDEEFRSSDSGSTSVRVLVSIGTALLVGCVQLSIYKMCTNLGTEGAMQTQLRRRLATAWFLWVLFSSWLTQQQTEETLGVVVLALLASTVVLFVTNANLAHTATGELADLKKAMLYWMFYTLMSTYVIQVVLLVVFSSDSTDGLRCIVCAIMLPVLFEMKFGSLRRIAYQFPGQDVEWPLSVAWASGSTHNGVTRLIVAGFDSPALGVLVVGLSDAIMRRTTYQRDFLWARQLRDVPHGEHVRNVLRTIDEISDAYAVASTLAITLLFRVSKHRVMDSAAPLVTSTITQLLLETVIDIFLAIVVIQLGSPKKIARLFARVKHYRTWPKHYFRFVTYWVVAPTVFVTVTIMLPRDDGLFCAWSRQVGSGWHRVPCSLAEDWLME